MPLAERLREALAARGVAWPAPVHHFESLGSTNDWLKEQARQAALPEWTAVLADRQTAGRGRQGRFWVSLAGNLFVSVLLRPGSAVSTDASRFRGDDILTIPLAVGVAAAEALQEMGAEVQLKWPNDLVADGAKLGGILVEGFSAGPSVDGLVVGIGVNLDVDPAQLPSELGQAVTSVRALTGRAPAVEEAAAAVLVRMRGWYDALGRDGSAPVLEAWRRRALPWWGREVEARSGGSVLRGIARGIDHRGALLLDLDDGRRVAVVAGEVRDVRPAERGA